MSFVLRMLSIRPLMAATTVVTGGAILERKLQQKQEFDEPFTLFRTGKTRCDAAAPVSTQDHGALVPIDSTPKQQLPPLIRDRTWYKEEEITTKTVEDDDSHGTNLFLLGTHHCDNISPLATRELLAYVQPDVIFVELCPERTHFLTQNNQEKKQLLPTEPLGNELSLEDMYMKLAKEYGGEFQAAQDYVESMPPNDRPILILGDRSFSVTNYRMLDNPNNLDKSWTIKDLTGSESPPWTIFPKEGHEQRALAQVHKAFKENPESFDDFFIAAFIDNPDLTEMLWRQKSDFMEEVESWESKVLRQERDVYMACRLIQACRELKPKRMVAVVGADHLNGISHLIRAGNIGTTIEPEGVLQELLATECISKDDPRIEEAAWSLATFRKATIDVEDDTKQAIVVSDQ